jgi:hypothetical protein
MPYEPIKITNNDTFLKIAKIESELLKSFRAIDALTPTSSLGSQLKATAKIASTITGDKSLLTALRKVESATLTATSAFSGIKSTPSLTIKLAPSFPDIAKEIAANNAQLVKLAESTISSLKPLSGGSVFIKSLNSFGDYAKRNDFTVTGSPSRLAFASDGALGLATTTTTLNGITSSEAVAMVASSTKRTRPTLRAKLASINPALAEKMDGAALRIREKGADSFSQAATSLVELVDWTLRELAKDKDVMAWYIEVPHQDGDIHEGRPTRRLKTRYILRERTADAEIMKCYINGLLSAQSAAQKSKHTLGFNNIDTLRGAEGLAFSALAFMLDCER